MVNDGDNFITLIQISVIGKLKKIKLTANASWYSNTSISANVNPAFASTFGVA